MSLVESHGTKPSWSILLLLWPSRALLKTVCSSLAAKPGFPPPAPDKLFFSLLLLFRAPSVPMANMDTSITKSKAPCGGGSVHLDLLQVEQVVFLPSRASQAGTRKYLQRIFFLIPAYSIYKGQGICKHPQSTRCTLSFCFLRFHVCLHYNKSK